MLVNFYLFEFFLSIYRAYLIQNLAVTQKRGEIYEIVRYEELDTVEKASKQGSAIKGSFKIDVLRITDDGLHIILSYIEFKEG